jgi:hypothetical protein
VKGLTLYQPYASLIGIGAKTIETRSWGTSYRGPLLIHAARRVDSDRIDDCLRVREILDRSGFVPATPEAQRLARRSLGSVLGHVLAVATLADCRPMLAAPSELEAELGHFGPGRFGWVLEDLVTLTDPMPWGGFQGLWGVPCELLWQVECALPRGVELTMAPPRDLPGQALLF